MLNIFKKENFWKLVSMVFGVTAIVVGFGPYIFEALYEAVIASVSVNAKYVITGIFFAVNGVALYFGKKNGWKHAGFVMSVVMISCWMAEPIKAVMATLTQSWWMKGIAIGAAVISIGMSIILHTIDRKSAE